MIYPARSISCTDFLTCSQKKQSIQADEKKPLSHHCAGGFDSTESIQLSKGAASKPSGRINSSIDTIGEFYYKHKEFSF